MRSGLLTIVYLVVGVIVAASHHYFQHADTPWSRSSQRCWPSFPGRFCCSASTSTSS